MIATLPARLRRAVSPYTGIVGTVEECLPATSDPQLFQAAAEIGRCGLLGGRLGHITGIGGTGSTRAAAAAAAVGEAIERYSATYVPEHRLVAATARELGYAAVEPERFALFSDRQYREARFLFRPFTSDTRIAWVEGRRLPGGESAFLPAELVYLGHVGDREPTRIGYATSSGLACAEHEDGASVRGLLELLERDAFMIAWCNRLCLPLIDSAGSGSREPFECAGLGFAAVDLSVFHDVPTVLGVVRAPEGFPGALGVGAAAAPTVEQAWSKALAEAFAVRSAGAKLALLNPGRDLGERGERVESFDDHILFYADHANAGRSAFLDASAERREPEAISPLEGDGPAGWTASLCSRVEAVGSSAYAVDVTSPDVAELGLAVVRVVAPELCPLDVSHSARFLGGRRLYEAAARAGLRPEFLDEDELNPDPHPFP